jgi:hypothetical protein
MTEKNRFQNLIGKNLFVVESHSVGKHVSRYIDILAQPATLKVWTNIPESTEVEKYHGGIVNIAHDTVVDYEQDILKMISWQKAGLATIALVTALTESEEVKLLAQLKNEGIVAYPRLDDRSYTLALDTLNRKISR